MKVADFVVTEIDELGFLEEQIKNLQDQTKVIKDRIKEVSSMNGVKQLEGTLYCATYTEANRKVVDYKEILAEMNCPAELIAKHTSVTAVYSLKLSMKK